MIFVICILLQLKIIKGGTYSQIFLVMGLGTTTLRVKHLVGCECSAEDATTPASNPFPQGSWNIAEVGPGRMWELEDGEGCCERLSFGKTWLLHTWNHSYCDFLSRIWRRSHKFKLQASRGRGPWGLIPSWRGTGHWWRLEEGKVTFLWSVAIACCPCPIGWPRMASTNWTQCVIKNVTR